MPYITSTTSGRRNVSFVRSESDWERESRFILASSPVATAPSLRRRRALLEERGSKAMPLHMLPTAASILAAASADVPPDRRVTLAMGGVAFASVTSRARTEWFLIRGRRPDSGVHRTRPPRSVAAAVIERDWPHCQLCGGEVALGEHHLDHIRPYALGGEHTVQNLRLAHDVCNMRRGVGGTRG